MDPEEQVKYVAWSPCNIYPTAIICEGVSIGAFSEVGELVAVGPNTRIGAHCFLPEGVSIGAGCFIGPGTVFTNDKYPPSPKSRWQPIRVEDGASIGAGCVILPGVTIGKHAQVGAGSVITKDVPPYARVWGNPARIEGGTIVT